MQGRCVGVKIPVTKTLNRSIESAAFTLPDLHHDELAFSDSLSNNHRIRFLGGRIALRRAMGPNLSQRVAPVLRGPRGAPPQAQRRRPTRLLTQCGTHTPQSTESELIKVP